MASSKASSDLDLHALLGPILGLPAGFVQCLWICPVWAVHSAVESCCSHKLRHTSGSYAARTKLFMRIGTPFSSETKRAIRDRRGLAWRARARFKTDCGMHRLKGGGGSCWAAPQGSSQLRQCARSDGAVQMGRCGVQQNGPRRDCRLQPVDRHHAATCTHRALPLWQGKGVGQRGHSTCEPMLRHTPRVLTQASFVRRRIFVAECA